MRRIGAVAITLLILAACEGAGAPANPTGTASVDVGAFTRPASLVGEPCGLAVSGSDVWILACSGNLLRIPARGGAARVQHLGGEVLALDGLISGSRGLWGLVSTPERGGRNGAVVPVDTASGARGRSVAVGAAVPTGGTEVSGQLWVGMLDGRLLAIDGGEVRTVAQGRPITWVAAASTDLWVIEEDGAVALRHGDTGRVRWRQDDGVPGTIAATVAFGALFAATPAAVFRIGRTGARERLAVGGTVNALELCGGRLWISQPDHGVRALDADGRTVASVRLDVAPRYLACDGSRVWVLAEDGRLGALKIST